MAEQVNQNGGALAPVETAGAVDIRASFTQLQGFELAQRVAKMLASSTLVPQRFQGNLPNCVIAIEMASRLGASVLMVMQNLYVVHGNPGWSAKFLVASFNQCGRFSSIRYEWVGTEGKDDWGCRAWAIELKTGERVQGPMITIGLAKKEGWYQKSGSKWQTIPQLMLMYRSAAWLINTHAPEISMGLNTVEEIGDTVELTNDGAGSFAAASRTDQVAQKLGLKPVTTVVASDEPIEAEGEREPSEGDDQEIGQIFSGESAVEQAQPEAKPTMRRSANRNANGPMFD